MSDKEIEVKHVVVHILAKEQHGAATIELSPNESDLTQASQRLINDICGKYAGKAGKGYGHFENDSDNYPMSSMVEEYTSGNSDFHGSSCRMMNHLLERTSDQQLATGGYVLFSHVEIDRHDYLLVAIVNATTGSAITREFAIQDSVYLDIAKLRVAGRIDLTSLSNGAERYISFLKGQNSVSTYFKKFLGCNDVLIARRESEKLRKALKEFATEQGLSEETRESFLESAYDHLKALSKNDQPLSIEILANAIWPADPAILTSKLADENLELSDGFVPDGRVIRGLVTYKGKSQHWELKFDRAGIVDGSVEYNQERNEIVLRNIPDKFRDELIKEVIGE